MEDLNSSSRQPGIENTRCFFERFSSTTVYVEHGSDGRDLQHIDEGGISYEHLNDTAAIVDLVLWSDADGWVEKEDQGDVNEPQTGVVNINSRWYEYAWWVTCMTVMPIWSYICQTLSLYCNFVS